MNNISIEEKNKLLAEFLDVIFKDIKYTALATEEYSPCFYHPSLGEHWQHISYLKFNSD